MADIISRRQNAIWLYLYIKDLFYIRNYIRIDTYCKALLKCYQKNKNLKTSKINIGNS